MHNLFSHKKPFFNIHLFSFEKKIYDVSLDFSLLILGLSDTNPVRQGILMTSGVSQFRFVMYTGRVGRSVLLVFVYRF